MAAPLLVSDTAFEWLAFISQEILSLDLLDSKIALILKLLKEF